MLFSKTKALIQNKFNYLLCCLSALFVLAACEDPNELGLELVDDNISGKYTDTVTVNVSTVLLDSLSASGTGTILVGQYTAPSVGTLTSASYFQVAPTTSLVTLESEARFDSIKLILPYAGYTYGDTTQNLTLQVNELAAEPRTSSLPPILGKEDPISLFYQSNAIYNIRRFAVKDEPLASYTFVPRPANQDTIEVDLPNTLGQQWFDMLKVNDERIRDTESFTNYFKGIRLQATAGASVIAIPTSATKVRLYYSKPVNGIREAFEFDFDLVNTSLQYNRITNNLEGTPLAGLARGKALPAANTGGLAVVQTGAGLAIKLEMPYLQKLREVLEPNFINKAVLVVEPKEGSAVTYPYPVPQTLGLYVSGPNNVPLGAVAVEYDRDGAPLTSSFLRSTEPGKVGRYEFSVTEYLINTLKNPSTSQNALLLAPDLSNYNKNVNRLLVDQMAREKSIKLKIYYTTIK